MGRSNQNMSAGTRLETYYETAFPCRSIVSKWRKGTFGGRVKFPNAMKSSIPMFDQGSDSQSIIHSGYPEKKTQKRKIGVQGPEIKPPKNWVFVFSWTPRFCGSFFLESEILGLGTKNLGVQKTKTFF